jgi:hypothetical protein
MSWLTSSRYVGWLEKFHVEQRDDFQVRIAEKDARIRELRIELGEVKAENDRMKLVLMPALSLRTPPVKKVMEMPLPPLDWQGELQEMLKGEKDGISDSGRVQVNQSGADDGA